MKTPNAKTISNYRNLWLVATAACFLAIFAFSVSPVHAINHTKSYCSGSLSANTYKECGQYSALSLSPYLNSSTNGNGLYVGYCVGSTCTTKFTTPGNYGATGSWSSDTSVYSIYENLHSFTVSFSGTDYWTWN
jgi:hypothetical protein